MKISRVLEEFLNDRIVIGCTKKTIKNYKQFIEFFINFTEDIDIKNLTYKHYQNYIIYLRGKEKLSTCTIRTYARHIKIFLTFAYTHNYIKEDISNKIKLPKQAKKQIEIISNDDILRIINNYKNDNFLDCRNLLIISLLLDCGLRISELTRLKLKDFYFEKDLIKIFGKGQKERYVPLSDTTKKYFNNYLKHVNISNNDLVLLDLYTKKGMTVNSIRQVIKRLKYKLKINNLYPHLFRHTFATLYIVNGGDSLSLKQILGHTSFYMVENYCHLASAIYIAKNKQYAPLSNMQ